MYISKPLTKPNAFLEEGGGADSPPIWVTVALLLTGQSEKQVFHIKMKMSMKKTIASDSGDPSIYAHLLNGFLEIFLEKSTN